MDHVKVDFGTLKTNVLIGAVRAKYGVPYKQPNAAYLRADCPLPSHTSKESKGSFAVNLARNIWCCKSTSCNEAAKKKGGDVLDFVSLMEACAILPAAKKLLEWFPQNPQNGQSKPTTEIVSKAAPNVNQPAAPVLESSQYLTHSDSSARSSKRRSHSEGFVPVNPRMRPRRR